MKLLYITNAIDGSGGLERVLSVKTKVFTEDFGYEIHIITLSKAEPAEDQASKKDLFFPFSDKIVQHKIDVSGNPLQYISKYISGIKKVVAKVKPEIILVCDDGLKAFFLPQILGNKIPIIYERHVSKLIEISENQGFIKYIFTKLKFTLMDFLAKDFTIFTVCYPKSGVIDFSQGDTKTMGVYSQKFEISPFTQGFCLRAITTNN